MRPITVNKQELLKVLQQNRDEHKEIFAEALEGYRKKVIEELEARLAAAKAGRKFDAAIRLVQPENHTDDYDRIIKMLEMDINPSLELEEHDFQAYVLNQWGWSGRFLTSNATYSPKAAGMLNDGGDN